jgi:oligopeptide transport system permease protein
VPVFVLSLLLSYLFSAKLNWLPTYGLDSWACYILPVVCLSFNPIAYIARQTRSSMLEALEQDYIRTARAKGVSERNVVLHHALKNSLIPVITYFGPELAYIVTGSLVVEQIFAVPGIGRYFVNSITGRDYTLIMGTTIVLATLIVVMNLVSDILYKVVDPRITLE